MRLYCAIFRRWVALDGDKIGLTGKSWLARMLEWSLVRSGRFSFSFLFFFVLVIEFMAGRHASLWVSSSSSFFFFTLARFIGGFFLRVGPAGMGCWRTLGDVSDGPLNGYLLRICPSQCVCAKRLRPSLLIGIGALAYEMIIFLMEHNQDATSLCCPFLYWLFTNTVRLTICFWVCFCLFFYLYH